MPPVRKATFTTSQGKISLAIGPMSTRSSGREKREEKMTVRISIEFDGKGHLDETKVLSEVLRALHNSADPLITNDLGALEASAEISFRESQERVVEGALRISGIVPPSVSYPIGADERFFFIDYEKGDLVPSVWSHIPGRLSHTPYRENRRREYGVLPEMPRDEIPF